MPEATNAGTRQPIRLLAQRAREALVEAGVFVRSRSVPLTFDGRSGRKWHLFADQPIDSTETCAISCAVAALAAVGESPEAPLMREAVETLLLLQLPSGGWTSWVNNLDDREEEDPEEALIIDTYMSLYALHSVGLSNSEPFARGIDWFRRAQDAAAGAWGFYPGGEPQVLPTSMAIVALSFRGIQADPLIRDVVNRGVEWLLGRQQPRDVGSGWSIRDNRSPSAVHTAWALRALTAAGYDPYSPAVVAAREWILDHADERDSIIDHYVTPGRTAIGRKRPSRAITHINFADGIIVHGLLAAGANLLDSRFLGTVETLIAAQEREGHWWALHAPREQPIYAVMDACAPLRLFVDAVQRHESVLEVSERVQEHEALMAELSNRLRELTAENHAVRAEMRQLRRGLVALRPLMWLTRLVVRWPVLTVLVVLQIVAYALAAFTVPPQFRTLSLVGGLLLTIATALTFWAQAGESGSASPHQTAPQAKESTHGA